MKCIQHAANNNTEFALSSFWKWESLDYYSFSKMHQNQLMLKSTEVTRWLWTRTVGYTKGHFPVLTSWPKENRLTSEHRQYVSFNTFKIRFILQSIIVLDCHLTISSTQVRAVLHDTCGDAPDLWRQTRPGVWWTQSAIKTRGGKGSQRVSISAQHSGDGEYILISKVSFTLLRVVKHWRCSWLVQCRSGGSSVCGCSREVVGADPVWYD